MGKWHLGHNGSLPTQRGFDYFFGTPYSHDEGYPGPFPISLVWPPVPVFENEVIVEQPIDLATITPRMTDRILNFIDESAASSTPFFLYVAYHEPHIPAFTSEGNAGRSRGGPFGDMVEQMDDSIGVIMERIRELGNTLVFVTSDNGAWPDAQEPFTPENAEQGDGGSNGAFYEGKASTWEGGVRIPAIAWYPGHIPAGRVVREIASHVDLFPTFLEYAEVPLPSDREYDGKSLVALLEGETETGPHTFQFFWRERTLMAVRWGRYKGHFVTRSGFGSEDPVVHDPMLLFDIERDLSERYPMNITNYPDIVQTIREAADQAYLEMTWGPPQFDVGGTLLGQSWQIIPCCQRQNVRRRVPRALGRGCGGNRGKGAAPTCATSAGSSHRNLAACLPMTRPEKTMETACALHVGARPTGRLAADPVAQLHLPDGKQHGDCRSVRAASDVRWHPVPRPVPLRVPRRHVCGCKGGVAHAGVGSDSPPPPSFPLRRSRDRRRGRACFLVQWSLIFLGGRGPRAPTSNLPVFGVCCCVQSCPPGSRPPKHNDVSHDAPDARVGQCSLKWPTCPQ